MQICFFGLTIEILRIWGFLIYLSNGVLPPPPHNFRIAVIKPKQQIYIHLMTVDQGGQKNRNGQTTVVFVTMFFTSDILGRLLPIHCKQHPPPTYKDVGVKNHMCTKFGQTYNTYFVYKPI
jgi:hypothetical protein